MSRLLLLNGVPGVGKSTIARRWVAEHPGSLVCDIDLLRTWVGGWQDAFLETGAAIRPAAQGLIRGYLASGDVVLPQLFADPDELDAFAEVATSVGADVVHVVLRDPTGTVAERFARRTGDDPWHDAVRHLVEEAGGDAVLARYATQLDALVAARPGTIVVDSVEGDPDGTYAAVVTAIGE